MSATGREALRRAVILECVAELDRFGERATVRHIRNALLSMRERPAVAGLGER